MIKKPLEKAPDSNRQQSHRLPMTKVSEEDLDMTIS